MAFYGSHSLKQYRLFISHAWTYSEGYDRLVRFLDEAPRFNWANHSSPKDRPAVDSTTVVGKRALRAALKDQIHGTHCVLIVAGMYASHREWIQAEMDIADEYGKPMIGVRPWGQERTPTAVSERVHEMVGWNTSSIVSAIRRLSL